VDGLQPQVFDPRLAKGEAQLEQEVFVKLEQLVHLESHSIC